MLDKALERQRASNTPIDITPGRMLTTLLTTGRGWLLRKGTELVTIAAASAGAYLTAHQVPDSVVTPMTAFITAAGAWLVSLVLSRLADRANKALPPPAK
jgi:hypothetical protein